MKNLLTVAFLFGILHTSAQSTFKTSLQADSSDAITDVIATSGGYVMVGYTTSYGAGNSDAVAVKTDAAGNVLWSKVYGDAEEQTALSIVETNDGGYLILGETQSLDTTGRDIFLLKVDAVGTTQWSKTYRGTNGEYAGKLLKAGNDYFVTGYTWSFGTASDYLLMKTDESGNIIWAKHYDGSNFESCFGATVSSDGSIVMAGSRAVISTDEAFAIKTDTAGNLLWAKEFGGTGVDQANTVVEATDGGYVFAGSTQLSGPLDYYVVKIDADGSHVWTRTCGTSSWDGAYDIVNDGSGFVVSGEGYAGDYYVLHFNDSGILDWERIYDNGGWERSSCIATTTTGDGFIAAGFSETAGARDMHVVQFSGDGAVCDGDETDFTTISTQASNVADVVVTTGAANLAVATIAFTETNAPFSKNEICHGVAPTGTAEQIVLHSTLNVFPNPAENWVDVQIISTEKNLHMNIYNSIGTLAHEESLEFAQKQLTKRVSLKDFAKGIYHIKISGEQTSFSKSLLIQ